MKRKLARAVGWTIGCFISFYLLAIAFGFWGWFCFYRYFVPRWPVPVLASLKQPFDFFFATPMFPGTLLLVGIVIVPLYLYGVIRIFVRKRDIAPEDKGLLRPALAAARLVVVISLIVSVVLFTTYRMVGAKSARKYNLKVLSQVCEDLIEKEIVKIHKAVQLYRAEKGAYPAAIDDDMKPYLDRVYYHKTILGCGGVRMPWDTDSFERLDREAQEHYIPEDRDALYAVYVFGEEAIVTFHPLETERPFCWGLFALRIGDDITVCSAMAHEVKDREALADNLRDDTGNYQFREKLKIAMFSENSSVRERAYAQALQYGLEPEQVIYEVWRDWWLYDYEDDRYKRGIALRALATIGPAAEERLLEMIRGGGSFYLDEDEEYSSLSELHQSELGSLIKTELKKRLEDPDLDEFLPDRYSEVLRFIGGE